MPTDEGASLARQSFGKGRLEAFSDGVFAIAITLLVLDIVVHPSGTPLEQVLHAWPAYLTYVISFLTIGAAWIEHTALTDRLERSDSVFLRLNLLLLLMVAFLPFPTRLLAEGQNHLDAERVAVTMYGLTPAEHASPGVCPGCVRAARRPVHAARRERGAATRRTEAAARSDWVRDRDPHRVALSEAAIAVYLDLAVYLVVPFRDVSRLLFPRR